MSKLRLSFDAFPRAAVLAGITMCLMLTAAGTQAQNAPAAAKPAEQKPVEQKPAAATAAPAADAKKAADTKSAEPKSTDTKAANNKTTDNKAADNKAPDSKAAGNKAADTQPAVVDAASEEKARKKNAKADVPPCVVAEFRALGMDVHDPIKRRTQAMTWLKKRAKNCSVDQLLMIRNNRSQWMGTADSAALATEVDSLLEAIAADNPQVATILYGTAPSPSGEGDKGK